MPGDDRSGPVDQPAKPDRSQPGADSDRYSMSPSRDAPTDPNEGSRATAITFPAVERLRLLVFTSCN